MMIAVDSLKSGSGRRQRTDRRVSPSREKWIPASCRTMASAGRFTCGGADDFVDFLLRKACRRQVLMNRTHWPKIRARTVSVLVL